MQKYAVFSQGLPYRMPSKRPDEFEYAVNIKQIATVTASNDDEAWCKARALCPATGLAPLHPEDIH